MYHPDQMYEQIKMRQADIRRDEEKRWLVRQARAGKNGAIAEAVKSVQNLVDKPEARAGSWISRLFRPEPVVPYPQKNEC